MVGTEIGMQPCMELMMSSYMLDCEMKCLESKIHRKNDESAKLESRIKEYNEKIFQLEKSIKSAHEKEEKYRNNFNSLRNSRDITEGLVMSMKHELRITQAKRAEIKNTRDNIIGKYSNIFQSYRDVYKSLPWIQKNHELKVSTELKKIQLNMLKLEYSSYKKKLSQFHKIGEMRMRVAIINFAKQLVERNNLQKEINTIVNQIASSEANLIKLKEEKIHTLERIDLKVKAAVAEARERAAKAQTVSYNEIPKQMVTSLGFSSSSASSVRESIFSRLGLGGPLSLKRPLPFKPTASEKVPRVIDALHRAENILNSVKVGVDDNSNKHDHGLPPETNVLSGNVSDKLAPFKNTKKPEHNGEKLVEHSESGKKSESILPEKIIVSGEKQKPIQERLPQKKSENIQSAVLGKQREPKQCSSIPEVSEGTEKTSENIDKKKKKLLKKKVKKVTFDKLKQHNKGVHEERNISNIAENKCQDTNKENSLETSNNPMPNNVEITVTDSLKTDSKEVIVEESRSHKPDGKLTERPPVASERPQSPVLERATSVADLSIDTDSVLSGNFNFENQEEIYRNIESPDFFVQRPRELCFSPPFGQSSPVAGKSAKDIKKPMYDFGDSPALSPPFMMVSDIKSSASKGQTSSFSDFFGSSSPKKSNQSTKSFFQLFG